MMSSAILELFSRTACSSSAQRKGAGIGGKSKHVSGGLHQSGLAFVSVMRAAH